MLPMHIFLVGMTGGGKSTLGRKLAANLGIRFVDTDQRVCEMMGLSEADIIKQFGEEFYQNAETGVLMGLSAEPPSIVATGGRMPMLKENVKLMQNQGIIIHVEKPLDQLLAEALVRQQGGEDELSHDEIVAQYNRRIGYYRACADHTLDNAHGPVQGLSALTEMVEELA
ncbi:MAG TPA: shikimate kinase [Clostridiales bacterium]|jgi:shikimate kinase|nr:shikimate kinase [Clostridiales bacterium]